MEQKNILPRTCAKPIEQLENGQWIVRYLFRKFGTNEEGEELVTFGSSVYPEKPTLQQIQRSINIYKVGLTMYGEVISSDFEEPDLSAYMFTD